jgi:hypothetical protein
MHYYNYDSNELGSSNSVKFVVQHFTYYEIPLTYKGENFILEACELEAPCGLQVIPTQNGDHTKMTHRIVGRLDCKNPDHVRFIKTTENIRMDSMKMINQLNNHFLNGFINYPQKDVYLEIYLYLGSTIFTDRDGKFISWNKLENIRFTFIPKIHIKNIYLDSMGSFCMEVLSAVITSNLSKV